MSIAQSYLEIADPRWSMRMPATRTRAAADGSNTAWPASLAGPVPATGTGNRGRPHRADRPLDDVKLQPAGARDVPHHRPRVAAERDRQRFLVRRPPPHRRPAATRLLDLGRSVVAPAHRDRASSRQAAGTRSSARSTKGRTPCAPPSARRSTPRARPADSGTASRSSSSSASPLRSGGVPVGMRKPATFQFEGRSRPGNCSASSSWPARGPTRSSRSASTRRSRIARGIGAGLGRRHRN